MGFLGTNWTATAIYALDGDLLSFDDLPAVSEVPVLLVDFPPASEEMASIAVHNANGWRVQGTVQFILAHPIGTDAAASRLLAENLRVLLRGRRVGKTVLEGVEPFSAMGQHDGKWLLFVGLASFYRDAFQ
jgi:hypothetical protein